MKSDLTHHTAVELARLIRTKKASPVEVTEAHLAAIERLNPAGLPIAPRKVTQAALCAAGPGLRSVTGDIFWSVARTSSD